MKKVLATTLILLMINISIGYTSELNSSQKSCSESTMEGQSQANVQHSSAGWWAGGIGSGILLGLIGTGIIWGVSFASNPQPMTAPDEVDELCFRQGYKQKAKGKNKVGAGVGGLIGTGIFLVLYLSLSSSN